MRSSRIGSTMKKPLVSCVCVTYDRPHVINELLYCFLAQDYENKELIILNDQKNLIYQYVDPRVKITNLPKRFTSLGEKRNFTRNLVSGDYIFILDDDDIYYSNHLSRLLEFHLENDDYDIVANKYADHSQDNRDIVVAHPLAFNGACITREYYLTNNFPNDVSCGEDLIFVQNAKTEVIDDGSTSWHYRWGMNVWHMSALGGHGVESYGIVTNKPPQYFSITQRDAVEEFRVIKLTPMISDGVKKYYR